MRINIVQNLLIITNTNFAIIPRDNHSRVFTTFLNLDFKARNKIEEFFHMNYSNSTNYLSCKWPRKPQATEILLSLIWRKPKKERPKWMINELSLF